VTRSREEILADGEARFARALLEAGRLMGEFHQAIAEAEAIRAEVEDATGVALFDPAPTAPAVTRHEDLGLAEVVEVRKRCSAFQSAAELLVPLLETAPHRSVGSVLKTCPRGDAARIREGLEGSEFFS
jgi:hypothetical protein